MPNNSNNSKPEGSKRRKQTKGETEALRLKRLRKEFSPSPRDPDEPELPKGFPLGALKYAFKDAQQIHCKPKGRFNPQTIVLRTCRMFSLTEGEQGALVTWLYWLRDRKWVSRDPSVSAVLQWLFSGAASDATWCGDPNHVWRAKVDVEHADRQAASVEGRPSGKAPAASRGVADKTVAPLPIRDETAQVPGPAAAIEGSPDPIGSGASGPDSAPSLWDQHTTRMKRELEDSNDENRSDPGSAQSDEAHDDPSQDPNKEGL